MDAVIRQACSADLAAIDDITRRAYAKWLSVLGHPPVPVTEDYVPRVARGEVWLARLGDTPAALIVLERKPDHEVIFSVAVGPDHAGKGLGQRLIAFAEDRTKAAGLGEIRLYTNVLMEANIALYERLGFYETGRRTSPINPAFTIVDMAKTL